MDRTCWPMTKQNLVLGSEQKEPQKRNPSSGFIMLTVIPLFLVILALATAMAGCLSCSIRAMVHRNEMIQAYPLLEDDDEIWKEKVLTAWPGDADDETYEKFVSTRNVGPYVLLVKELRHKMTGKVFMNRLEFIPMDNSDDHKS